MHFWCFAAILWSMFACLWREGKKKHAKEPLSCNPVLSITRVPLAVGFLPGHCTVNGLISLEANILSHLAVSVLAD